MISRRLPRGWVSASLGDLGLYVNGRGFRESDWSDKGLPIVRIQNLTGSSDVVNRYNGEVEERFLVRPGDLLVSWAATLGAFFWRGSRGVLNQHIFRVESFVDIRFHKYVIDFAIEALLRRTHGSGIVHVTRSAFDSTPVALPPLPEQRRIVAEIEQQFTRLDAGVAALSRVRVQLKRYRASVLKAACEGRLLDEFGLRIRPAATGTGDAAPGPWPVPDGWTWKPLGSIAEIQGGIQKQPSRAPGADGYPFLRVANVHRGRLDLEEVRKVRLFPGELERLRLRAGDLLIVEGNGSRGEIGRMAIWTGTIQDCVHQNHIIRARLAAGVDPRFTACFWNSPGGARGILDVASSTSGLYTLSVRKVAAVLVPIPPLAEQHRIVAEVERRLSVVDELERLVEKNLIRAAKLRQAILKRAFEGRLVPQDPSDEPASVLLDRIRAERTARDAAVASGRAQKRSPRVPPRRPATKK